MLSRWMPSFRSGCNAPVFGARSSSAVLPPSTSPSCTSPIHHRCISTSLVAFEDDNVYKQLADILKNVKTPTSSSSDASDSPSREESGSGGAGTKRREERHAKDAIDQAIMGFGRPVHSKDTTNYSKPPGDIPSPLHRGERELQTRWHNKDRYRTCLFSRPAETRPLLDPMNVHLLLSFMNAEGRILPRRATGLSVKYQRKVSRAIKRAKHMGIFSYKKGGFTVINPFTNPKKLDELASVNPRDLIMYEIRKMEKQKPV